MPTFTKVPSLSLHAENQLVSELAELLVTTDPKYIDSIVSASVANTKPQLDQVTFTIPTGSGLVQVVGTSPSVKGKLERIAQSLATTAHLQKAATNTTDSVQVFCRYTGFGIQVADNDFPSCKVRSSRHWIFDQNFHGVAKLDAQQVTKNHKQRTLLALAYLLQPTVLAPVLHLKHPASFSPSTLLANFTKIQKLAQLVHSLPTETREQLYAQLPHFNSQSIVAKFTGSSLALVGTSLLQWVDEVTSKIYDILALSQPLAVASFGILSQAETDKLATILRKELSTLKAPDTGLGDYWYYILEEVTEVFSLSKTHKLLLVQQLSQPTGTKYLNELYSYILGIIQVYDYRGTSYQIPKQQLQEALNALEELITTVKNSQLPDNLELTEEETQFYRKQPKPAPVGIIIEGLTPPPARPQIVQKQIATLVLKGAQRTEVQENKVQARVAGALLKFKPVAKPTTN